VIDNDVTLDELEKDWGFKETLPIAAARSSVWSLAHGGQRRQTFAISGFLTNVC
jgi:hypothetical protein